MPQIFPRSANDLARISIVAVLLLGGLLVWALALMHGSGYRTGEGIRLHQPVPFSHEHHVRGLGLDCRYCHTAVETAATAGIPPIATCMNCHRQIWTNANLLEPVREAWRSGVPLRWERVHDLPDFVYFNHSVHIAKGIGCAECHGQVDRMPLTVQVASLDMQWCLDCHKDPSRRVRPRSEVFNMEWDPRRPSAADLEAAGMDPESLRRGGRSDSAMESSPETGVLEAEAAESQEGAGPGIRLTRAELAEFRGRLAKEYDIHSLTSCSTCHR